MIVDFFLIGLYLFFYEKVVKSLKIIYIRGIVKSRPPLQGRV